MSTLTGDDRARIADVLVRYATGIDRRDWELFATCFTDDCAVDYGDIGAWQGVAELTGWMRATHEPCGHTLHRVTNVSAEGAGDRATARAYVDAVIMGPEGGAGARALGFYDDELVRVDGAWRIAARRFTLVHVEPVGGGGPA